MYHEQLAKSTNATNKRLPLQRGPVNKPRYFVQAVLPKLQDNMGSLMAHAKCPNDSTAQVLQGKLRSQKIQN